MKKNKKSKKLKGMTLVEIVVSVALLVIIATMLVIGAVSAVSNMRTANKVSEKTAVQAPYAANRMDDSAKTEATDSTLNLSINGGSSVPLNIRKSSVNVDSESDDKVGDFRYFKYVSKNTTAPATEEES